MSNFSTQLEIALERSGMTRVQLAEQTGMVYGTLTNYALGIRSPSKEAMASILSALPPHEAADLLMARLRDEIPTEHEGLVSMEPRVTVLAEAAAPYAHESPLPDKLETAMRKLRSAVRRSPEWADIVEDLAKVLP